MMCGRASQQLDPDAHKRHPAQSFIYIHKSQPIACRDTEHGRRNVSETMRYIRHDLIPLPQNHISKVWMTSIRMDLTSAEIDLYWRQTTPALPTVNPPLPSCLPSVFIPEGDGSVKTVISQDKEPVRTKRRRNLNPKMPDIKRRCLALAPGCVATSRPRSAPGSIQSRRRKGKRIVIGSTIVSEETLAESLLIST
ncbi:hypothetical protein AVEN_212377-1 [Araneus ventricosus]|uniref:Uncharacterized protein n=1 Tax=Araneus ventricosus TaxID=182803 RepID=A0A4Y2VTU0_ARAVE|nr:hypothetical protein AVEN_212377-1 [Araneus ventricosus]